MLHRIGRAWGSLLCAYPSGARATTERNLKACFPELAGDELAALARESLQNTACTALEMGKCWLWPLEKTLALVTESEGLDAFNAALAEGKGVILLAPHLGNWEVFGFSISDNIQSTWLYQPPRLARLDQLIRRARSRGGVNMVATDRRGVASLLKALQAGQTLGILPDQVPGDEGGEYAPFFGQQAFTMTLVSKLVQRTGVKVFCGFARRLPDAEGFKVTVMPADPLIYSKQLMESVTGLNRSVEQCARLALSQYQWEYKRFRRQPGGEKFY